MTAFNLTTTSVFVSSACESENGDKLPHNSIINTIGSTYLNRSAVTNSVFGCSSQLYVEMGE